MSGTEIYRGWIAERDYGETDDALFLDPSDEPLAAYIAADIESEGQYLTVRYFISDEEQPIEALETEKIKMVLGASDVSFRVRWSDITGYLWTDEAIQVGGHDLLQELSGNLGKFCHLEITYNDEPLAQHAQQHEWRLW